jgi:hypothetical protein
MAAPSPAFLCKYTTTLTLAAGTPQSVDVPTNGARDWLAVLKNTGSNAVTALTIASSPLGEQFEDATTVTSGIPLAASGALGIRGKGEPATTVRLVVTSTSGTTITVEAGGW